MSEHIRWRDADDGEATGYVGSLDRPVFRIWPPDNKGDCLLFVYIAGHQGDLYHGAAIDGQKAEAERLLAEFVSSLGAIFEPEPDESAAFQLSEARDMLARWDAGRDDPDGKIYDRERVLADQVKALLAIVEAGQ